MHWKYFIEINYFIFSFILINKSQSFMRICLIKCNVQLFREILKLVILCLSLIIIVLSNLYSTIN